MEGDFDMSNTTRYYQEVSESGDREPISYAYINNSDTHTQCVEALINNGFSRDEASNIARAFVRIYKNDALYYAQNHYPN